MITHYPENMSVSTCALMHMYSGWSVSVCYTCHADVIPTNSFQRKKRFHGCVHAASPPAEPLLVSPREDVSCSDLKWRRRADWQPTTQPCRLSAFVCLLRSLSCCRLRRTLKSEPFHGFVFIKPRSQTRGQNFTPPSLVQFRLVRCRSPQSHAK